MNTTAAIQTTPMLAHQPAVRHELLNQLSGLKNPPWHRMTAEDRLLHACLCAYRKHVIMNDDFGWEELAQILDNTLCEVIGEKALSAWVFEECEGSSECEGCDGEG